MTLLSTTTHRSEDHVQGHGNVEVEGVVVNHADGEEHGHHDHIIAEMEGKKSMIDLLPFCVV